MNIEQGKEKIMATAKMLGKASEKFLNWYHQPRSRKQNIILVIILATIIFIGRVALDEIFSSKSSNAQLDILTQLNGVWQNSDSTDKDAAVFIFNLTDTGESGLANAGTLIAVRNDDTVAFSREFTIDNVKKGQALISLTDSQEPGAFHITFESKNDIAMTANGDTQIQRIHRLDLRQ